MGYRVLYLVRHGQYVTKEDDPREGQLTTLGRRQSHRLGQRLAREEIQAIYHSDMPRAVETAEIIAQRLDGLPRYRMRVLREMLLPLPRAMGGTPLTRQDSRELKAITASLKAKFLTAPKGNRTRVDLVVAHGNLIRHLVCLAMRVPTKGWYRLGTNNCGLTVLVVNDSGPNFFIRYNDVGHLPKSMQTMT